jgi:hypothetical protein
MKTVVMFAVAASIFDTTIAACVGDKVPGQLEEPI